jgi:hypothetical protein
MKTKILILKLLGVLFMSCSVAHLQTSDTGYYPPTNAEYIEVYSTEKASRPYTEIGEVFASVEAFNDGKESVNYLKKEAAKLGADGIINLRLEISNGVIGNSVTAFGTAVKFRY